MLLLLAAAFVYLVSITAIQNFECSQMYAYSLPQQPRDSPNMLQTPAVDGSDELSALGRTNKQAAVLGELADVGTRVHLVYQAVRGVWHGVIS